MEQGIAKDGHPDPPLSVTAAALAAIRGVRGQWLTWLLLGVPAAITINAIYAGLFLGVTALMQRSGQPVRSRSPSRPSTPGSPPQRPASVLSIPPRAAGFYEAGSWVTRPELATHRPQSAATQAVLDRVCQGAAAGAGTPSPAATTAVVFDPPSNIRLAPNGAMLCAVTVQQTISIQGRQGDWLQTDHCGQTG